MEQGKARRREGTRPRPLWASSVARPRLERAVRPGLVAVAGRLRKRRGLPGEDAADLACAAPWLVVLEAAPRGRRIGERRPGQGLVVVAGRERVGGAAGVQEVGDGCRAACRTRRHVKEAVLVR